GPAVRAPSPTAITAMNVATAAPRPRERMEFARMASGTQSGCQRQPSQLSELRPCNPRSVDSSGAEMSVRRTVGSAGGQREFFRIEKIEDGPRPKGGTTPALLSNVKESGHQDYAHYGRTKFAVGRLSGIG